MFNFLLRSLPPALFYIEIAGKQKKKPKNYYPTGECVQLEKLILTKPPSICENILPVFFGSYCMHSKKRLLSYPPGKDLD